MYVIAGLGNPGKNYEKTRHNMGFQALDRIADKTGIPVKRLKHKALIGDGRISGERVLLVKPQTYMNNSGQSLGEILRYYDIEPEHLIVIYDDIDLEPGQIRIRRKGSAGSHNGMKSIISCLGNGTFTRVRIGIGSKPEGWDLADYVLSRPAAEERVLIDEAVKRAADAIEMIVSGEPEKAMSLYNNKNNGTAE